MSNDIDKATILVRLQELLKGYLGEVVDLSLIAAIAQVVGDSVDELPEIVKVVRVPARPRSSKA
jgi:hypothetical protein